MARLVPGIFLLLCFAQPSILVAEGRSPRTDAFGDPLPEGALVRLGTLRFRFPEGFSALAPGPEARVWAVVRRQADVILWDFSSNQEVYRVISDQPFWPQLAFSADGRYLALNGHQNVLILDSAGRRELRRFNKAKGQTGPLFFSADGTVLALGNQSSSNEVHAWDVVKGKAHGPFKVLHDYSLGVALSSDGQLLASWGRYLGSRDHQDPERSQTVQLWDVAAGQERQRLKTGDEVRQAVFALDGRHLAVAGSHYLTLWDVARGRLIRRFVGRQETWVCLAFSQDSRTLVAASQQGTVQTWDVATGRRLETYEKKQVQLQGLTTIGNRLFAWGSQGQTVHLWDVRTGRTDTPSVGHQSAVRALAFSPDGQDLFSADEDGQVCTWEWASGRERRRLEIHPDRGAGQPFFGMADVAFSPGGNFVASVGRAGSVCLNEIGSGREVSRFPSSPRGVEYFTFSVDGNVLCLADDTLLHTWDVATGQALGRFPGIDVRFRCLTGSPNGRVWAASGMEAPRQGALSSVLRVWDAIDGKERFRLPLKGPAYGLCFSPDGTYLAMLGTETGLGLWDPVFGTQLSKFVQPGWSIQAPLAYSPDGRLLAAGLHEAVGNTGHSIVVWETASGTVRHKLPGHRGAIRAFTFSPDSRLLASGCEDSSILVWDLTDRWRNERAHTGGASADSLERLWLAFNNPEAREALPAMQQLMAVPEITVPFLARKLTNRHVQLRDQRAVERLIADLDANEYAVRDKATRALEELGRPTKPHLLRALERKPGTEQRRRLEGLLTRLDRPDPTDDRVRLTRALEVLEQIATPDARRLIEKLAEGDPEAALTREATAVLKRLSARTAADSSPTPTPPK